MKFTVRFSLKFMDSKPTYEKQVEALSLPLSRHSRNSIWAVAPIYRSLSPETPGDSDWLLVEAASQSVVRFEVHWLNVNR